MPRTLKNNDSLLNFFVGREAFSPVWSEGQVVQMGPGDQAGQVVRWSGGQVVRWSGDKSGQGWFVRVSPYEISVFLMNYIFFLRNEIISWGKKHTALFQTHNWEKPSFFNTLVNAQLYGNT